MSQIAPRPPLRDSEVKEKISQYWRVSVVEVTGSTQEDIAEKIFSEEIIDGDVVVAEFQSAGRGRLDRKFEAPHSSALTFSFYIEPERDKEEWSLLPLLTGMAAVFALQKIDPDVSVNLKWPNDLLVSDLKVGGIISQVAGRGVIIGVGINVAMDKSELPVPLATSLFLIGYKELNRNHLLAEFLNNFEEIYLRWNSGEDLRHLYREMCATIGRAIRADLPNGNSLEGVAIDISAQGELILADGLRVTVGDIVHLR